MIRKTFLTALVAVVVFSTAGTALAQTISLSELVELFISLGIIAPDKIEPARAAVQNATKPSDTPARFCFNFNRNLRIGESGADVVGLQQALAESGIIAGMEEKGVFSESLASAVVEFQEKYASEILTPNGLRRGTGYVGPSTRSVLNRLYGCSRAAIPRPVLPEPIILPPQPAFPEPIRTSPRFNLLAPNGGVYDANQGLTISWTPYTGDFDYYIIFISNKISNSGTSISPESRIPKSNTTFALSNIQDAIKDILLNSDKPADQIKDGYYIEVSAVKDDRKGGAIVAQARGKSFTLLSTSTQPSITVLSPNGGEIWKVGEERLIQWNYTGTIDQDFDVRLLKEGSSIGSVHLARVPNGSKSFKWTIPQRIFFGDGFGELETGGAYRIIVAPFVTVKSGPSPDQSDASFTITSGGTTQPSITVLSPNGGENWRIGSTQSVKYASTGLNEPVNIWIRHDNYFVPIIGVGAVSGTNETKIFSWTIPSSISPASGYTLCVGSQAVKEYSDCSNAPFTIIADPNQSSLTVTPTHFAKDIVGTNYVFGRGAGVSWSGTDWRFEVKLKLNTTKTLSSIKVTGGGVWSTSEPAYYPILVEKEGKILNSSYGETFGPYQAGRHTLFLYGQIEPYMVPFTTGQLMITFTDGTSLTATIPKADWTPPPVDSVALGLYETNEDKAGTQGVFGPGKGLVNIDPADWSWHVRTVLDSPRTVKAMHILHDVPGEGWSTTDRTNLLGKILYPLVVYRNGVQVNTAYNQELGSIGKGSTSFTVYGQRETIPAAGTKVIVEFADGTSVWTTFPKWNWPKPVPIAPPVPPTASSSTIIVNNSLSVPSQNITIGLPNQFLGGFEVKNQSGEQVGVSRFGFSVATNNPCWPNSVCGGSPEHITNVSVFDASGTIVAGPVDVQNNHVVFTDTIVLPVGVSRYVIKGKLGSAITSGQQVHLDGFDGYDQWTLKGQSTGASYQTNATVVLSTMTAQAGGSGVSASVIDTLQTLLQILKNVGVL